MWFNGSTGGIARNQYLCIFKLYQNKEKLLHSLASLKKLS